jgi:NAD(P)-dependent dehydrogenase (short-subunit alcohol dehydrogenase family)
MILDRMHLKGKSALVTGASKGLGRVMAIALAEAGADLGLTSRTVEGLNDTAVVIQRLGCRAAVLPADVTDVIQVRALAEKALEELGRIDILVNAAGGHRRKPILDVTEEDWDYALDLMAKSTFFMSQAVVPAMIRQGKGKIINVGSLGTAIGLANASTYCAAKGAIAQVTKAMAIEWAPYSINVNTISPGYYYTEMTAPMFQDPQKVAWFLSRIPLGRTGLPDDLGGLVVFLASESSDYITGQTIYVDGGWVSA